LVLARRGRGGSSGSSELEEYVSEGAELRGLSVAGSSGMQWPVVRPRIASGRDNMVADRSRNDVVSMYFWLGETNEKLRGGVKRSIGVGD